MFRFSNGLKMHSGVGMDGKSYFVFEGENLSIKTNSEEWHLEKKDGPTRIWWRNIPSEIIAFKKSLHDGIFPQLSNELENLFPELQPHPSIKQGIFNDAKRIFPSLNEESNLLYKDFIHFLDYEFDLSKYISSPSKSSAYSEDLGPCMVGTIDGAYVLPPEIPRLYSAPKIWSQLTWLINNHFSGPYPGNAPHFEELNGRRFDWGHLKIDNDLKNKKIEGLVYFFIAKFIIVHEAWAQNKAPESLNMLIELIQKNGERPWQYLY
jgi:hypothetical protein|tara:strand:+ start:2408 stop:3199 length:792 start_codon:yes stop_codon:yes gene_type:complete